ncbi:MAG TPA: DUF885 domain-containing protein, partial [Terriglobia bacterium]|nr:DUF885 domain-containing protein [Terriglobia bacterium]
LTIGRADPNQAEAHKTRKQGASPAMKKMTRRESILTMASAIAAGGIALQAAAQTASKSAPAPAAGSATAQGAAAGNQTPQPSAADRAFQKFVDQYFDGYFQFDPASATSAGIHQYDGELPGYSQADIQREIARNQRALRDLGRIPASKLSAASQLDATVLQSLINGHLLDLVNIRMWAKDPNFYNTLAGTALFTLIERDFAPIDERLKSLTARESRIPDLLNIARANVVNPPAVYTKVAIEEVQAQIEFLQNVLPQAVVGAQSTALKAEFAKVNQSAVAAYQQFLDYLQKVLTPQSQGNFAIGVQNYQKKLLYDEMVDNPLKDLLKIGQDEMRRVQSLFTQAANIIDSTKTPLQVLESVRQNSPGASQVAGNAQSVLNNLRQFVLTHEIVTIPPAPIPQVAETPSFMRALSFASMDTPGPFEEHSIQSFFYLTLPGPAWTEERTLQLLQFFNTYAIRIVAIHEVYPGHYVQFLWLKQAPTKARMLTPFLKPVGTNSEGWAHYCEEMMLEQGYGEGDPSLLLIQLQASLIRLCRYIAGIQMHTAGMTVEQATNLFQQQAYMDPANAEREAMRGTFDPTYLAYTLGKLEIMKLREDYKQKVGDKFNLKAFHDQFLSYGIVPIKMIREQMLQDGTPVL